MNKKMIDYLVKYGEKTSKTFRNKIDKDYPKMSKGKKVRLFYDMLNELEMILDSE